MGDDPKARNQGSPRSGLGRSMRLGSDLKKTKAGLVWVKPAANVSEIFDTSDSRIKSSLSHHSLRLPRSRDLFPERMEDLDFGRRQPSGPNPAIHASTIVSALVNVTRPPAFTMTVSDER